jgi:hypothetical protein
MSALMTPRRSRRTRRDASRRPAGQSSLFASAGAVVEEPVTESAAEAVPETFTTASARRHGPTLDDLVAGAWEGLLARAPADCLVCGTPLTPRQSAGAGVVGGRCDGCGSTLG